MTALIHGGDAIGLVISLLVFAYLFYALLRGEDGL
jgi:K+-transporting ATPase KdpF subunit